MTEKRLLMGNEAIARGAVEAGVKVATAYPGTPSSEVFATLAHFAKEYGYYAEWSVNEKVALEVAAGAAYAGARAIVSMKQVGLNVAADPLMTLAYIGIKGGLVLLVADDPGPHSSQNEQDTRKFAQFAKLPVLDPSTPQEAKDMAVAAFEISEETRLPVILRPTTRVCHVCQDVAMEDIKKPDRTYVFEKDPSWVIFPSLAYQKHIWLNDMQEEIADAFNYSPFNKLELKNRIGVVACGVSYNYVREALTDLGQEVSLLKIGTPYPLPEKPVLELLNNVDKLIVIEEQEPVVEEQIIKMAWQNNSGVQISGKNDKFVPREGEFNVVKVRGILAGFLGIEQQEAVQLAPPPLPARNPILCAGCPHRASFFAAKEAVKGISAVFAGDIGCYTLGVAPPLNAMDTCLCMGASVTIASGLSKVEEGVKHLAFLGDSTYFHTGVAGLANAVYNNADITLVVLDNSTTAMTGHQPHPGLPCTATGMNEKVIDIAAVACALGVESVRTVDPYNLREAVSAVKEAVAFEGPSVVIMKRECAAIVKPTTRCEINNNCTGCKVCLNKLGCPALVPEGDKVRIGETCTGCGLCQQVCPSNAIEGVAR